MYLNPEFIARILVILGSSIFLLLGVLHGILTLKDLQNPRTFTPPDPALRQAMQQSSLAIDPTTNLWQAWLGFNLSHSLGLIVFGGTFMEIGLFHFSTFAHSLWLQIVTVVISTAYLLMSLKFWFSQPAICAGIALACFAIATGLRSVQ
jgi:hypothetical protein